MLLLMLVMLVGAVAGGGYDHRVNYWQAFAPGKLLQRLDALTSDDVQPGRAVALAAQLPVAQAKLDEDANDGEVDELETETDASDGDDVDELEASSSVEGHSGEDYERNYEQFVRQYFDRLPDDSDEDAAEQDESVESQAEASNLQQQQKPKQRQQHCRHVRRNGQLCEICREPRNNEVSETCSYSHEEQPEQYAYGSGSQYRRYRDIKPEEQEQEQEEEQIAEQPMQSPPRQRRNEKRHTTIVQPADGGTTSSSASSSLCERRLVGKSVCYECKDGGGQQLRRCYDAELNKLSKSKSSAKPHASQTQQQRIYKRTISYSYAQGSPPADGNVDGSTTLAPEVLAMNSTVMPALSTVASMPPARRLTKVVRRRRPAPAVPAVPAASAV